jgi:hypothetical protein
MKTENVKNYGEYVEIASPIQETVFMTQNVMGGEIWYN